MPSNLLCISLCSMLLSKLRVKIVPVLVTCWLGISSVHNATVQLQSTKESIDMVLIEDELCTKNDLKNLSG